jgi:hypothetical protein
VCRQLAAVVDHGESAFHGMLLEPIVKIFISTSIDIATDAII